MTQVQKIIKPFHPLAYETPACLIGIRSTLALDNQLLINHAKAPRDNWLPCELDHQQLTACYLKEEFTRLLDKLFTKAPMDALATQRLLFSLSGLGDLSDYFSAPVVYTLKYFISYSEADTLSYLVTRYNLMAPSTRNYSWLKNIQVSPKMYEFFTLLSDHLETRTVKIERIAPDVLIVEATIKQAEHDRFTSYEYSFGDGTHIFTLHF